MFSPVRFTQWPGKEVQKYNVVPILQSLCRKNKTKSKFNNGEGE